jgi:primosomal protein N'
MSQDEKDVMHRYVCRRCFNVGYGFGQKTPDYCRRCRGFNWKKEDQVATVAKTETLTGSQFDSIETINHDVDAHREETETQKSWREIEESRRQ